MEEIEQKNMLVVVESLHQVMCDMVFEYRNELYILPFINYVGSSITTQNDSYNLGLTILHYFSNTFFEPTVTVYENCTSIPVK